MFLYSSYRENQQSTRMKLPPKKPNCVLSCQQHSWTLMASFFRFFSLHRLQQCRRYLLGLLSFLLLIVLACNGANIFCLPVPFPAKIPRGPASFLPENVARISKDWQSALTKQLATLMYSVKEENSSPILQKSHKVMVFPRKRRRKHRMAFKMLHPGFQPVR